MSRNTGPLGLPRLTSVGPLVTNRREVNDYVNYLFNSPYWNRTLHPLEEASGYDSPEEFIAETRPKKMMRIEDINTTFNKPSEYDNTVESMVNTLRLGNSLPPIIVSENGYLQDGRHRLKAYMVVGFDTVEVAVGIPPGSVDGNRHERLMTEIWHIAHDVIKDPLDERYGGIPAGGGFDSNTEYEIGAQRIAEECHCILGSLGKIKRRDKYFRTPEYSGLKYEKGHIEEELGLIIKDVEEYSKPVYTRQLQENPDGIYVQEMMNEAPVAAKHLQTLAKEKISKLDPNNKPAVLQTAKSTYEVLIALGEAMEHSLENGIPSHNQSAFKDYKLHNCIKTLEKDVQHGME